MTANENKGPGKSPQPGPVYRGLAGLVSQRARENPMEGDNAPEPATYRSLYRAARAGQTELHVQAKRFADSATELSALVASVVDQIKVLPAKLPVEVTDRVQHPTLRLFLGRMVSEWDVLVAANGAAPAPLNDAPLPVKARGAALLPDLVRALAAEFKARLEDITTAFQALSQAKVLLEELAKKGGA